MTVTRQVQFLHVCAAKRQDLGQVCKLSTADHSVPYQGLHARES